MRRRQSVHVESIAAGSEAFELELRFYEGEGRVERLKVDRVIANPGFRPDTNVFSELQIHRCYATDGPIKLAAHLLGESSDDCLQQSTGGVGLLQNPEPNFYILGAASYGRDSRFLLQNGLQQVEELFDHLSQNVGA